MRAGRRQFLGLASFVGLLGPLGGCRPSEDYWWKSEDGRFAYGVASGDPLSDRVIIWTRLNITALTPRVKWKVAEDAGMNEIVTQGEVTTDESRDFTVKVDVTGLQPGTTYYYQFWFNDERSPIGRTKTLPIGRVERVRLASTSCSNFPAGYFHVYEAIAAQDLDAVVHLGDYLYEYGDGGYATAGADELGRAPSPSYEVLTLSDYRTRHAQYRRDIQLQACHAQHPFIVVWDDHEVANNAYRDGAVNHSPREGDYGQRRSAAFQAWREWMPVRENEDGTIHRRFDFGDLVRLTMLDTRHEGRDRQLEHEDFRSGTDLDTDLLRERIDDPGRTMLGEDQKRWLMDGISRGSAKWQVLGQQTLMGRYFLPKEVALSVERNDGGNIASALETGREILSVMRAPSETVSALQRQLLESFIPYNLDSWDGYAYERDEILRAASDAGTKLVVLSGDTHNAWASRLTTPNGHLAGAEFGSSSVTSPGYEDTLGSAEAEEIGRLMTDLISDLKWVDFKRRGFVLTEYTESHAKAQFLFVSSIRTRGYDLISGAEVTLGEDDSFVVREPEAS